MENLEVHLLPNCANHDDQDDSIMMIRIIRFDHDDQGDSIMMIRMIRS